jgi:hypothetical protein
MKALKVPSDVIQPTNCSVPPVYLATITSWSDKQQAVKEGFVQAV